MVGDAPQPRHDVVSRARRRLRLLAAPESDLGRRVTLAALLVLTALIVVLNVAVGTTNVPALSLVVPTVLGGLLLSPRPLTLVLVVSFGALIAEALGVGNNVLHAGAFVVLGVVAVIAMLLAQERERLGLSVGRGDQMLLELRDRLQLQGQLPALPAGWHVEAVQQSAGGASFGGDFLVSTLTTGGCELELVLVDVSGKGVDAGTRALMLSGALGGLLGAVPSADFLGSANGYLLRQQWDEGFATAVHLRLDVGTGSYQLTNAGHPPGVHYRGGTGQWEMVEPPGTVLGLLPDPEFGTVSGRLAPHDALLLYTDGLIEVPGRDLSVGIDRLLGGVERLIPRGFAGGVHRLLDDVAPTAADDRALVLIWRD